MSCNILTVRPLADGKTTVRLQNMSRFSDPPDSNAVDLLWHAETKFHLWPQWKLCRNHDGQGEDLSLKESRCQFLSSVSQCVDAGNNQRTLVVSAREDHLNGTFLD